MRGSSSETSGVWERWNRWSNRKRLQNEWRQLWTLNFSRNWSQELINKFIKQQWRTENVIHKYQKVSYRATTEEWCSHNSFSTQECSDRFASEKAMEKASLDWSFLHCFFRCDYKVLGISANAQEADIKQAHRKLALLYHPDKKQQAGAAFIAHGKRELRHFMARANNKASQLKAQEQKEERRKKREERQVIAKQQARQKMERQREKRERRAAKDKAEISKEAEKDEAEKKCLRRTRRWLKQTMPKQRPRQRRKQLRRKWWRPKSMTKPGRRQKKNAAGLAKEELQKMKYRARQSVQCLVDLKTSQNEAVLVKEAVEKFQMVQEAVAKAADAAGPFLMAEEEPKASAPNHGNVMTTSGEQFHAESSKSSWNCLSLVITFPWLGADEQFHEELFAIVSQEQRGDGSAWWSWWSWCCCLARQKWAEANDAFTADATSTSLSNLLMLI